LTTHYLEEAEYLCDDIAIINKGKIIANENKKSLLTKFNEKLIYIKLKMKKISDEDKISLKKIGNVKIVSDTLEITFKPNETSMNSIIKTLHNSSLDILDLSTKDASLEDVFINMINNK
jgi:ABC-2 type transport system ATP-binding protein